MWLFRIRCLLYYGDVSDLEKRQPFSSTVGLMGALFWDRRRPRLQALP